MDGKTQPVVGGQYGSVMPASEGAQPTPVTGVVLAAPVTGVARAERTLMVMHEQQSRPGNGASSFISGMVRAVQSLPATVEGLVRPSGGGQGGAAATGVSGLRVDVWGESRTPGAAAVYGRPGP